MTDVVNRGSYPNDPIADSLYDAFGKINTAFSMTSGSSGSSGTSGSSGSSGQSGSAGASGSSGTSGSAGTSGTSAPNLVRGIVACFDGGGSDVIVGSRTQVSIPYNLAITSWTILSDTTGSIVVDVWRSNYASYPPTASNSIAGSEKPTLSSSNKNTDNNLTTWTTSLSAGDTLVFNVDSCSGIRNVTVVINGL